MSESRDASCRPGKMEPRKVQYTVPIEHAEAFIAAQLGDGADLTPTLHPEFDIPAVEASWVPAYRAIFHPAVPVRHFTISGKKDAIVTVTYAPPGWVSGEPGEAE